MSNAMIEKRCEHGAIAFPENIYVFWGLNDDVVSLRSAEKLHTTNEQWKLICSMNITRAKFGPAINGHKLYCFSGSYDNERSVEYFDL